MINWEGTWRKYISFLIFSLPYTSAYNHQDRGLNEPLHQGRVSVLKFFNLVPIARGPILGSCLCGLQITSHTAVCR